MTDHPRLLSFASAAVLALVLGQPALAQPPATAPAAAPAPATSPADAARAQADQRRAAMDAERTKRYAELRARAAEMGLDLPETPPWVEAEKRGLSFDDMKALRAEHQAMHEKMRNASPEERRAMREEFWKKMRARAAERGVDMPETPPWVEAEKRYKEARERFEQYRKTVEAFSKEQREAAEAVFGAGPDGMEPPMGPMPPRMPMPGYGPFPGYGAPEGAPAPTNAPAAPAK